jgi:hypothetical protein
LQGGTENPLGEHFNRPSKNGFEVLLEGDHVEQRAPGFHIHEQVDVAGGSIVTTCNRSEHTNIPRAMTRGQFEDFGAMCLECLGGQSMTARQLAFSSKQMDEVSACASLYWHAPETGRIYAGFRRGGGGIPPRVRLRY